MLTKDQMQETLSLVSYKDWTFTLKEDDGGRPFLQLLFTAPCVVTGWSTRQASRKWWLSPHMSRSELIRTVYKAVEAAEIHEMQEHFRYRGRAVFGPHIDIEALVDSAQRLDLRDPMERK